MAATDALVYLPFCGYCSEDRLPDRIHVLDWEGRFVRELALAPGTYIALDVASDGRRLLGVTEDETLELRLGLWTLPALSPPTTEHVARRGQAPNPITFASWMPTSPPSRTAWDADGRVIRRGARAPALPRRIGSRGFGCGIRSRIGNDRPREGRERGPRGDARHGPAEGACPTVATAGRGAGSGGLRPTRCRRPAPAPPPFMALRIRVAGCPGAGGPTGRPGYGPPPVLEALRGTARLAGRVVAAETGEPLEAALVALPGAGVGALTNATGFFALEGLDPGIETVEVRYLGRRSPPVVAELRPGELTRLELALAVDPVALEELEVTVTSRERRRGKLTAFYERMQQGLGQYITREEIERHGRSRLHEVFRHARSFRVVGCGGSCYVLENRRGRPSLSGATGPCFPLYYLDGGRINLDTRGLGINEIPLDMVEAIEIYAGPASIPGQYIGSDSGCGVVLLWTRVGTDG